MSHIQRAYVDQGDRQLHLRTAGEGRALLLVHQNAHSSTMWEARMPEVAANGRRAIALDLPGHGLSDPFPAPPSLRGYANCALSLLDALGVGGFDVLGQHLGASVGLQLVLDAPERVGARIGFGIFLPGGRFESAVTAAAPPVYDRAGAEVMCQWDIRWQLGGANFTAEMAVRSVAAKLEAGERRHLGLLAMKDSDHEAMVRDLTRRFLGISPHRDSFYEETQRAAALNSHVSFRDVGDEGLFFAEENPREYARVIEDFLSSVD